MMVLEETELLRGFHGRHDHSNDLILISREINYYPASRLFLSVSVQGLEVSSTETARLLDYNSNRSSDR